MQDSHEGKARMKDGCYNRSSWKERMSGNLHANFKKWASEEEQAAVPKGVIEEKAAVKPVISDAHSNLPFFCS